MACCVSIHIDRWRNAHIRCDQRRTDAEASRNKYAEGLLLARKSVVNTTYAEARDMRIKAYSQLRSQTIACHKQA
eukprot:scaffold1306_cov98-Skeletonema_dohrnii-CCMP3373.AAC.7